MNDVAIPGDGFTSFALTTLYDKLFYSSAIVRRRLQEHPPKGISIPLGAPYGHLPEAPSHDFLQKVRGCVDGLTKLREGLTNN